MADSQDLATEYADTMVESIADIMGRLGGTVHADSCPEHFPPVAGAIADECTCEDDAREELDESYALELVAEKGEPYSVLLTYGGPTAWVEWSGRRGTDSATLHVSWGSGDAVRRSSAIRELAEHYAEIMGDE